MKRLSLIAKNAKGNISHQLLPTVTSQTIFDVQTAQLAVIFDVKNSTTLHFDANFHTYNALALTRIMQEDFLWEFNCYELFLSFSNTPDSPYLEINLSPEGYFNLYYFDSYRNPPQLPPRRLQVTASERQNLMNFYNVRQNWQAVFWQDSLPPHRALRDSIEKAFPFETDNQRLVMIINIDVLANLLKVEKTDNVWLNPCAVFKSEQEMVYFAHRHACPPDFHDKQYWLKLAI